MILKLFQVVKQINKTPGEIINVKFKAWRKNSPEHKVFRQIEIIVNSKNEYKPEFEGSYTANINEKLPYGFFLLKVFASDNDVGLTGRLLYALVYEYLKQISND